MNGTLFDIFRQSKGVNTDTRTIHEGQIYFGLRGERFNGNAFAADALAKGAAYAVIDDPEYNVEGDQRYIQVNNSLAALQDLARTYRNTFKFPVFALTGSNGKTTTKELLHAVLGRKFKTYATKGNLNNHIGVPLTLLSIPEDAEMAVIEMGANKPGDIKELSEIALPDAGLITNIGQAHLERFQDLNGVAKTKGELFDFLRENGGKIILNEADPKVKHLANGADVAVTYGSRKSDFVITDFRQDLHGIELEISLNGEVVLEVKARIPGVHNAENILAAVAAGYYFEVPFEEIKAGVEGYIPSNNRSQWMERGGRKILMDAYNANPSSMSAAIRHIATAEGQRVGIVLGDMYELGPKSEELHRKLGRLIKDQPIEVFVAVGNEMKSAFEEAGKKGAAFPQVKGYEKDISALLNDMDVILIKGSRAVALEQILEHL